MGGARCSYRNCTKRSDKKTHLFHYPVFDKLRCHQWITNAQKLNYLNLKLSQLKNRMVCEYHFTDDCFMNVMRRKLKNSAIPTLDGPFCTKTKEMEDDTHSCKDIEMPINLDDIENEFTPTTDKKAHLSVIYGDFLTNDITEGVSLTSNYKPPSVANHNKGIMFNRFDRQPHQSQFNQLSLNSNIKMHAVTNGNQAKSKISLESSIVENKLPTAKVVTIDFDEFNLTPSVQNEVKPNKSVAIYTPQQTDQVTKIKPLPTKIPPTKKVTIISEKHISEPVKIDPGELQPVSPSIIIQVPDKKNKSNIELDGREIKTFYVDNLQHVPVSKNKQEFDSAMTVYTHLPQHAQNVFKQNENIYQPTLYDQTPNNLVIQNVDDKPLDYIPSSNYNNAQMQPEPCFTNGDMSTAPNVELVSCSLMGPSVFTLTDIPQVSTSATEQSYVDNVSQSALLSVDSEIMGANQQQASLLITSDHNEETARVSRNTQSFKKTTSKSPNKITKQKMPPEKLAAIEEKRKYNMKLGDILNACLNNMDEEPDVGKLTAAIKKEVGNKKVVEHLYEKSSKDSNQPDSQENIIAYFESRLQRMEDNLLNKIEKNSRNIIDVKKKLVTQTPAKKSRFTQTSLSVDAVKRSLYQEVSQYLSPDLNSLIYEELFINKCVSNTESKKEPKTHKRKRNNSNKEL